MGSRTASPARSSSSALVMGAGAATAAAAWLDPTSFAGFVAASLAGVVYLILAGSTLPLRIGAALGTLAFPFLTARAGDSGLLWSCTIAFVCVSFASIASGIRKRLAPTMAITFLVVVYLASLASHTVLIKDLRPGGQMVGTFLLMACSYEAAAALVENRLHGTRRTLPVAPDPRAAGAGMLACLAVTFGVRMLTGLVIGPVAVTVLGAVVAVAAGIGNAVGGLVAEGMKTRLGPGDIRALRHLNAVLMAAPAFYYGFRLYLA